MNAPKYKHKIANGSFFLSKKTKPLFGRTTEPKPNRACIRNLFMVSQILIRCTILMSGILCGFANTPTNDKA